MADTHVVYDPFGLKIELIDKARRDALASRFGWSTEAPVLPDPQAETPLPPADDKTKDKGKPDA